MIYDINTTNESFIEVCQKLKENGVKNYLFPLTLYDETLVGVNPFDEDNLTLEQKARIRNEIQKNIYYYLREIVRIKESGGLTRYKAHLANIAQTYCFQRNINVLEILPRQNGKTVGAVCNYSHVFHFATINSDMVFSNKQLVDSQKNIERFNNITDVLPSYLKVHLNPKEDSSNLSFIKCVENNNSIRALSTANDIVSADKLGRGLTLPLIWWDEFAFLKYNKIIFDASAFAFSKASESAEANGTPFSILITTTPSDLDSDEGSYCYSMIRNAVKFDFDFYNKTDEELKAYIEENSSNSFVWIQYDYQELGHDEKWLEKQKRLVNYDLKKIKREIFMEWSLASDTGVFSEEQLEELKSHVNKYIGKFVVADKWTFNVIEPLHNITTRNYVASIDIASAMEQDSTVITIIDPLTFHPVALYKSNKITGPNLVELLVALVKDYFYELVIVPERNNMGTTIIQFLLKTEIANHIYFNVNESAVKKAREQEMVTKRLKEKKIKKSSTGQRIYGINTTPQSRKIMIEEILNMIVNENPEFCNNYELLEEIKTLVRDKKGKVLARDGCHDDVVMSYLIGLYMIFYGNNVRQFLKVTYIGRNVENDTINDEISKRAKKIKKLNNLVSSTINMVDFNDKMEIFKNNNEKIDLNETIDNSVSSVRTKKIKRNINKILNLN